MKKINLLAMTFTSTLLLSTAAYAQDYTITIKNNQFVPKVLNVPANEKVKITVKNQNATPSEFESDDLDREKVVAANSEIVLFVGPLKAGNYSYEDDFHHDTPDGMITAK